MGDLWFDHVCHFFLKNVISCYHLSWDPYGGWPNSEHLTASVTSSIKKLTGMFLKREGEGHAKAVIVGSFVLQFFCEFIDAILVGVRIRNSFV